MTLDYTTAKALKDAGFPQEYEKSDPYGDWAYEIGTEELHLIHEDNDTNWRIGNDYSHSEMSDEDMQTKWVKCPLLSELIQELGEDFKFVEQMFHQPYKFTAMTIHGDRSFGNTPELACANLYLSIHKK